MEVVFNGYRIGIYVLKSRDLQQLGELLDKIEVNGGMVISVFPREEDEVVVVFRKRLAREEANIDEMRRRLLEYYVRLYGPGGRGVLEDELASIVMERGVTVYEALKILYKKVFG